MPLKIIIGWKNCKWKNVITIIIVVVIIVIVIIVIVVIIVIIIIVIIIVVVIVVVSSRNHASMYADSKSRIESLKKYNEIYKQEVSNVTWHYYHWSYFPCSE